jgi:hypothetical protein
MAFTARINLPNHVKGDTFPRLDFYVGKKVLVNGVETEYPIDLTGAQIYLQVRPKVNSEIIYLDLEVGDGLTLVAPYSGRFQIDEQIIDIPVGTHYYDIEITLNTGVKFTWFIGTWTITSDITHE